MNPFSELIEWSAKEKRGLTLFINGQSLSGIVVNISDDGVIELKSQTYSRIIVRLETVDAIAAS